MLGKHSCHDNIAFLTLNIMSWADKEILTLFSS